MDAIRQQRLDTLNGDRGDPNDYAVRMRLINTLLDGVGPQVTARKLTAAPTMADFNALLADVQKLYDAINTIRTLVRRG